jgi:hypothetical protein
VRRANALQLIWFQLKEGARTLKRGAGFASSDLRHFVHRQIADIQQSQKSPGKHVAHA